MIVNKSGLGWRGDGGRRYYHCRALKFPQAGRTDLWRTGGHVDSSP
jgi:hypothetical protein